MESERVVVVHRVPWNKGTLHRAEAAVKAPGNLGDPDETPDGVEPSRARDVQSRN